MLYYAGIGSRETPPEVLAVFREVAKTLAKKNFILRSGGAKGADTAFESGCDEGRGYKEIYLPWRGFENNPSRLVISPCETHPIYKIAKEHHPNWGGLSQGAKKLMGRNVLQVLGVSLTQKSSFIICWTKDGKEVGGTGFALRLAKTYKVPVINVGSWEIVTKRKVLDEIILMREKGIIKGE